MQGLYADPPQDPRAIIDALLAQPGKVLSVTPELLAAVRAMEFMAPKLSKKRK